MKLPSFTRNAPFYIERECKTTFNMYIKEIKLNKLKSTLLFLSMIMIRIFQHSITFVPMMIDFLTMYSNFQHIYDKLANHHSLDYADYQLSNYQNERNYIQLSHRSNFYF